VSGTVTPEAVNPVPVTVAPLTVTAAVPVEDKISDCVAGEFKVTSPNATLAVLIVSAVATGFNCNAKEAAAPLAEAVRVAVWAVLTAATVAVTPALVALAGTVIVAGTVTAELLLARLIVSPPLGAALLRVTVQASVPDPTIDPLAQVIPDVANALDVVPSDAVKLEKP
jgi:cation transporter-like permease